MQEHYRSTYNRYHEEAFRASFLALDESLPQSFLFAAISRQIYIVSVQSTRAEVCIRGWKVFLLHFHITLKDLP